MLDNYISGPQGISWTWFLIFFIDILFLFWKKSLINFLIKTYYNLFILVRGGRGVNILWVRGGRGVYILWVRGDRGVWKKNIKEIFFKISEKNILLFFLNWKIKAFFEKIWSTLDVFVKAEPKKNNTKN